MGKKRGKDRSLRGDAASDLSGATCTHIRKGIDHGLLRKMDMDEHWNACQACEEGDSRDAPPENGISLEAPAVWMCLKCGHRGCGRFSENQHAIKHYQTPRSDPHCLVLGLDTWSVWCYICDEDVHYSSTGQLAQLVSNIKKQTGSSRKTSAGKVKDESMVEEAPEKELEDAAEEKEHEKLVKRKDVPKEPVGRPGSGAVAVKGLSNLGNTCFFNAVLQNLSQTVQLRQLLSEVKNEPSSMLLEPPPSSQLDPLQVQLPQPGSLTLAMFQLLNEIQQSPKSVVTPRELFTQVCKKSARFKGFQQQDSQELLRYLLDGMRAEESTRLIAAILEAMKNSGKNLDEEQKKLAKEYERNGGSRNFVDLVFGGETVSTVMCEECKTVSMVTEAFLDLSLPVADEAYRKKNQKKGFQQKNSIPEDRGRDASTPLANGDEDMPTGAGSKYQQKKAKKQAKKQAKNQRRQQKQGMKLTLDSLDSLDTETTSPKTEEQAEDGAEQDESQPATSEPDKPAEEESTPSGSGGGEDEQEEEDVPGVPPPEEDELAESVKALSLQADGKGDLQEAGYVVVDQDPELVFRTLASRAAPNKQDCSVESCLHQFTEVEHLTQNNSLMCLTCTKRQVSNGGRKPVYREALKQMLISAPPQVLTLHLKRFQQVGYSVCKVNRHVQFPQLLDLAPFCSRNCKGVEQDKGQVLYSLYGIVEHSGTMRSGHYTAFVKTRVPPDASTGETESPKGSWFHISDSSVQPVSEAKVHGAQAYLLFYERLS